MSQGRPLVFQAASDVAQPKKVTDCSRQDLPGRAVRDPQERWAGELCEPSGPCRWSPVASGPLTSDDMSPTMLGAVGPPLGSLGSRPASKLEAFREADIGQDWETEWTRMDLDSLASRPIHHIFCPHYIHPFPLLDPPINAFIGKSYVSRYIYIYIYIYAHIYIYI